MAKIIALIGNTGVGKTSLVQSLLSTGKFQAGLEQHDERPFQTLFSQDPAFGLANQIDYFLVRAEQERYLRANQTIGLMDGGLEQDFHGFTKLFFQRGLLKKAEFELCERAYNFIRLHQPSPELFIYVTASRETINNRLEARNRVNVATANDIELIDALLSRWIATLPPEKLITVDTTNTSITYEEIISPLMMELNQRVDLGLVNFETGYIP